MLGALGCGPDASAVDLLEAVEDARRHDPRWGRIDAAYKAAGERTRQAEAVLWPEIGLQAGHYIQRYQAERAPLDIDNPLIKRIVDFLFPDLTQPIDDTFRATRWGINASYGLFDPVGWLRMAGARVAESQVEAEYRAAQQGLLMEVGESYFGALKAVVEHNFLTADLRATGARREQVQARYEAGLSTEGQVYAAEAAFDETETALLVAKSNLDLARGRLAAVTGSEVGTLAGMVTEFPTDPPSPVNVKHWIRLAEEKSPDLQAKLLAAEAARKEYEARKAVHYPTVDLVASYDDYTTSGGQGFTPAAEQATVGIELKIPLYQGGRIQAGAREGAHRWQEAKEVANEERVRVRRNAEEEYQLVELQSKRVEIRRRAVENRINAVDSAEANYASGAGTVFEYIDALRASVAARRDYELARVDYILHVLRLNKAVGSLSETEMSAINDWLAQDAPDDTSGRDGLNEVDGE